MRAGGGAVPRVTDAMARGNQQSKRQRAIQNDTHRATNPQKEPKTQLNTSANPAVAVAPSEIRRLDAGRRRA